ncbi:hypothetical protein [Streptomyces albogriseolus]|uniref:hypothetical protein n=1 Tax=Streptomyces albogriseolus TaxID=1887 RepID=UPI0033B918D7
MRIDVDQYLRQVARDLEGVRKATPLAGRRVLVTGAAGTLGRALGARFTELGAYVVGLNLHADASTPDAGGGLRPDRPLSRRRRASRRPYGCSAGAWTCW